MDTVAGAIAAEGIELGGFSAACACPGTLEVDLGSIALVVQEPEQEEAQASATQDQVLPV